MSSLLASVTQLVDIFSQYENRTGFGIGALSGFFLQ